MREGMSKKQTKILCSPIASGGAGVHFETNVILSFVVLMLTGGRVPTFRSEKIDQIKLQTSVYGYKTDDLLIVLKGGNCEYKLLGEVKISINITSGDKIFTKVIQHAWNDFNNSKYFDKAKDKIALITGPLNQVDTKHTRNILELAHNSHNANEFFHKKLQQKSYYSKEKKDKLEAFKSALQKANEGFEVSEEDVFEFLKCFHLIGYDLDMPLGTTKSLLFSLIEKQYPGNADGVWGRLVEYIEKCKRTAGTITLDEIHKEGVLSGFEENLPARTIPTSLVAPDTTYYAQVSEKILTIASLLGGWDENRKVSDYDLIKKLTNKEETDKRETSCDHEIINKLIDYDPHSFATEIRKIVKLANSPLTLKNGQCKVANRKSLWERLGYIISDIQLDILKDCILEVLREVDPRFELPASERYMASMCGKVTKYSPNLRQGLAETLALLGNHGDQLTCCSRDQPKNIAVESIQNLLGNADWKLWGSLDSLLPTLAEAEPNQFLSSVDDALRQEPCPFDKLCSQEEDGIMGNNHNMIGLLWALEALSWHEEHLVRASVILAELAFNDSDGNLSHRLAESLTTILLPWMPQTLAPIAKRITCIRAIQEDFPEIAWELLLSLLPNSRQVSHGTYKPRWSEGFVKGQETEVSNKDYGVQVTAYVEIIIEMAKEDLNKLQQLISNLDKLPKPLIGAVNIVLEHLSSKKIITLSEDERLPIWERLTSLANSHRGQLYSYIRCSLNCVHKC